MEQPPAILTRGHDENPAGSFINGKPCRKFQRGRLILLLAAGEIAQFMNATLAQRRR